MTLFGPTRLSLLKQDSDFFFFQLSLDLLQSLTEEGVMSVEEFVSRVLNRNQSQSPSASAPYRQLKRHHSTQVRVSAFVLGKFYPIIQNRRSHADV